MLALITYQIFCLVVIGIMFEHLQKENLKLEMVYDN